MRVEERVAGTWGARGCGDAGHRATEGQTAGNQGFRGVGLTVRRGGDEPQLGWNRAGAGLELGWNQAGIRLERGWSGAGAGGAGRVGLELSAPQEASGSSQRPVVRSSPRKSRPGGRGQALLRAPPSHSPAPSEAQGRKGGRGEAVRALSATALARSQGGPGRTRGAWSGHVPSLIAAGAGDKNQGERGRERGEGSKLKDTSSSSKTHATNDPLKSLGPKSSGLPGG